MTTNFFVVSRGQLKKLCGIAGFCNLVLMRRPILKLSAILNLFSRVAVKTGWRLAHQLSFGGYSAPAVA